MKCRHIQKITSQKGRVGGKTHHKRANFISTIKTRTEKPVVWIAVNTHRKMTDFFRHHRRRTEKYVVAVEESIEDTKIKLHPRSRYRGSLFPGETS